MALLTVVSMLAVCVFIFVYYVGYVPTTDRGQLAVLEGIHRYRHVK